MTSSMNSIIKVGKDGNWEILEIEEEKHSLWLELALAQWETKSLEQKSSIIGADLKNMADLGASEEDKKKENLYWANFFRNKVR